MSTINTLVPTGTVRAQFSSEGGSDLDDTLAAIAHIASREQFDPALVWTAKRLIANEPALAAPERLDATLATLALLIAIEEGSTRLPLEKPAHLDHVLHRLQTRLSAVAAEIVVSQAPEAAQLERAARVLAQVREAGPSETLQPSLLPTVLAAASVDTLPYRPLLLVDREAGEDGRALTSERMLRKERALATAFAEQARRTVDVPATEALQQAVASLADHPARYQSDGRWKAQQLNPEQANAVLLAALEPLALVTGGPGTGKTSIIVSILRLLTRLGVDPGQVALAAPTGKAAVRMRESIDNQLASLTTEGRALAEPDSELRHTLPDARTLHRLLGYSPSRDRFWRDADNPLDAKVVICDEASMIDLELMHALVQALPDDAHLVLVGDADQLPSIAGGAVFRDLVADKSHLDPDRIELIEQLAKEQPSQSNAVSSKDPMAPFTGRLHHSYRMQADDPHGRQILELAAAVRDCTSPDDLDLQATLGEPVELTTTMTIGGVHRLAARTERDAFIERWFDHFVATVPAPVDSNKPADTFEFADGEFLPDSHAHLERVFDHHANARILCVTQVFRTGARAINRAMHALFADSTQHPKPTQFLHLEPVIAQQNNYDLGIFNGDQGIVAKVRDTQHSASSKRAIFPRPDGSFRTIPLPQIAHQLEHAYATSIHKAQGSEFGHVAVVMPEEKMPLLTKQLLYTAVTRASKSVTIFDAAKLFKVGAATPVLRFTGLPKRLAAVLGRGKVEVERAAAAEYPTSAGT